MPVPGALPLRPGPPRRSPRDFCGGATWPCVAELREGVDVTACFLVHEKQRRETKAGKPFLELVLGDASGTVAAMVWDDAERVDACVAADDVVGVRARVGSYRDRLQLTVGVAQPLEVGDDDLASFLPASPRDRAEMARELDALVLSMEDAGLRALLERCVGRATPLGRAFRIHPAAKRNHHAYLGGLLEHSLSVAHAADLLAAHYRRAGAPLDRDLLVAAALLHDVGKVRELSSSRTFGYTDEGQLLGHILLGLRLVEREAEQVADLAPERLLHLQHLVASHQGRLEWASPKVPMTLEALILHASDELDARMASAARVVGALEPGTWSPFDRHLDRALYRPPTIRTPDAGAGSDADPDADADDGMMIDLFRG
jgi:3'-5' exoribonuclease